MGLIVNVYDHPLGDCTNNGISSRFKSLCVTNIEGPFEPDEGHPPVQLVKGPMNTARLVSEIDLEEGNWVMFGGNFAYTSDSRFSKACFELLGHHADAVKIFDRVEK